MKKFLLKHYVTFFLLFLWGLLLITNYRWGQTLTGWDNLHPEINPLLDISRSLSAWWQEYQGLGLLGGMAHGSDLVRQIVVLILSWFLPRSLIRYSLLMAMLLLGTLGIRRLFKYLFARQQIASVIEAGAGISAIFYLLNLGTMQNFLVAFEPYYMYYGTLPWLLYFLFQAWQYQQARHWWRFLCLSFLATPAYYIQTNYLVFLFLLTGFAGIYLLQVCRQEHPHTLKQWASNMLLTALVSGLANLFWLLPQCYFVFTGGTALTSESQINRLATPEVTIANQVYANPIDILLLRGYWWHSLDYNHHRDRYEYMLQPWESHLPTTFFGGLFALSCLVGIYYCWSYYRYPVKKRSREFTSFFSLAIVAAFAILVFLLLSNFFQLPVLSQIFRSPFTKVIASLSLLYSLLVGSSLLFFWQNLSPRLAAWWKREQGSFYSVLLMVMVSIIYAWPAFNGHFIYQHLFSEPPEAYQQLFAFFHTQPVQSRLALLPADTLYGWQFNNWSNYRGIGFYWFGISQPILARPFDVWSREDENFYRELFYSRYQQSPTELARVLQKYDVRYLLLDKSIQAPRKQQYNYPQVWQDLISEVPACQAVFQADFLYVYDCGQQDSFITAPEHYFTTPPAQGDLFADPAAQALTPQSVYLSRGSSNQLNQSDFIWPWSFLYEQEINPEHLEFLSSEENYQNLTIASPLINAQNPVRGFKNLLVPARWQSQVTFLLRAQYLDGHYRLIFSPTTSLLINQQTQPLYADIVIDLPPLSTGKSDFYLDFGTNHWYLSANSQPQLVTLEQLQSDQVWTIFPTSAAAVNEQGSLQVSLSQAQSLKVAKNTWQQYFRHQEIALPPEITSLKLQVKVASFTLPVSIFPYGINCDSLQRGSFRKQQSAQVIDYYAHNFASSCDAFIHEQMDISRSSYLLQLESKNIAGWPLHYYLWDAKAKVSVWENLFQPEQPKVLLNYLQGYKRAKNSELVLNLATRSLMGEKVHNQLLGVPRAWALDTHFLANFYLVAGLPKTTAPIVDNQWSAYWQQNSLQVLDVNKFATSDYRVRVRTSGSEPGLLVLQQGYHPGWQLRYRGQILPQVRINSWANGWLLDSDLCDDECNLQVVFAPQRWGYLALAVSGVAFITSVIFCASDNYRQYCRKRACLLPRGYQQLYTRVRRQFLGK